MTLRPKFADVNGAGYSKGIHYWSVKGIKTNTGCYGSIGITSEKNKSWTEQCTQYWRKEGSHSFFDGSKQQRWSNGAIITAKLDCNTWTVTYFKNNQQC